MCGIFGIVSKRRRDEVAGALELGSKALAHRGPDDDGLEVLTDASRGWTIGFAHRRLSILDPTPAGHQPMTDESNGNVIAYNGEVFNFRQLRRSMEEGGVHLRSETDTEVVLKSFGRSGLGWREAVGQWRGMFAFGLWNRHEGALSLVRDRFGIKPLYYHQGRDYLVFSSEVRALLASGLVPARLSIPAIDSFLRTGSVAAPLTIIEGVWSVLPGNRVLYQDGETLTTPYWRLDGGVDQSGVVDEERKVEEIRELVRETVGLHTVADVPISVFLSGGIDSSAIVSLLRQTWNGELRTFSVNFTEAAFNEQAYAEEVAQRYETRHTSILLSEGEILGRLTAAMDSLDQPSIDGINTWFVSEATAGEGMKVALSGLGGDEVFLGYRFFRHVERDERWRRRAESLPRKMRELAGSMIGVLPVGSSGLKMGELLQSGEIEERSVHLRRQLFSQRQRAALLAAANGGGWSQTAAGLEPLHHSWLEGGAAGDEINLASALELGGYLPNTLLRDTDVMSMAHGLEVRVPLLDHLLVEEMLALPGEFKLGGSRSCPKWLLVEAAGDLPDRVVRRRKKGFELPFDSWLRGALRPMVEDLMNFSARQGVLDTRVVGTIWENFLDRRVTWSRVWALLVLAHWIRRNCGGIK